MAGNGIGQLVVNQNLCPAAIGFYAEFYIILEIDTEGGQVFLFSGCIEISEIEIDIGDTALRTEGDPDSTGFAEQIDAGELAGSGALCIFIPEGSLKNEMVGIDLTEIPHIGEQDGRQRGLQGNVFSTDLVEGQADPAIVDGFFLFKINGDRVLFDQRQPPVRFYQQTMCFDDFAVHLEGGVVIFGVIVDRSILVFVFRDFYLACGIPRLLNDD